MKRVLAIMLSVSMLLGLCYIPTSTAQAQENVASTKIANNEIQIGECENGTVSVTPANAEVGETVTIIPEGEDSNYEVDKVYIQLAGGAKEEVEFSKYGYTFEKSDAVTTVSATFMKRLDVNEDAKKGEEDLKSIHQYVVGNGNSESKNQQERANRNSDDTIDVIDVVRYKKQEAQKAAGVSLTMEAENALCGGSPTITETQNKKVRSIYQQSSSNTITYTIDANYATTVECKINLRNRNTSLNGEGTMDLSQVVTFTLNNAPLESTGQTTKEAFNFVTGATQMYESVVATIQLNEGENVLKITPVSDRANAVIDSIVFEGDATDLGFNKQGAVIRFLDTDKATQLDIKYTKTGHSIQSLFPADSKVNKIENGLAMIGWDVVDKNTVATKDMNITAVQGSKFKFEAEQSVTTAGKETAFISKHNATQNRPAAESVYMKRGLTNGSDSVVTMDYVVYYSGSRATDFIWDIIMCHRSGGEHALDDMMVFSISYDGGKTYNEVNTNGILDNKADTGGATFATAHIGNVTLKPGENHLHIKGIKGLYANVDYITLGIPNDVNRLNQDGRTADTIISEVEGAATTKITEIQNTSSMDIPQGAKVYYVAAGGDDTNLGTTPEEAWKTLDKVNATTLEEGSYVCFKRGDVWRGQLITKTGVTYTAYGEGAKPQFYGSPVDAADDSKWTKVEGTENVWKYANPISSDIGSIIFNHESSNIGKKVVLQTVGFLRSEEERKGLDFGINFAYSDAKVVNQVTMKAFEDMDDMEEGQFYHRVYDGLYDVDDTFDKGYVYVCSKDNPGQKYNSIEFLTAQNVITVNAVKNVTLDNLCVKYTGAHGISALYAGKDKNGDYPNYDLNLTCQNMEIGDIGGSISAQPVKNKKVARYGNGIQVWKAFNDFKVENCYIYNCYDAGITPQTPNGEETRKDMIGILIRGNVIKDCTYNIEYFTPGVIQDFTIEDNYLLNSGSGIGQVRLNEKESAFIKGWHYNNETSSFKIDCNYMVNAKDYVVQTQRNISNAEEAVYTNNTIVATTRNYSTNGYIDFDKWVANPEQYLQAFDEKFEYTLNGGFANASPNKCWFIVAEEECKAVCGVCRKCTDTACKQHEENCSGHDLILEAEDVSSAASGQATVVEHGTVKSMNLANGVVVMDYYIIATEDICMKLDMTLAHRDAGTYAFGDFIKYFKLKTPVDSELQPITSNTKMTCQSFKWSDSASNYKRYTVTEQIHLKQGINHLRIVGEKKFVYIDNIILTGDTSKIWSAESGETVRNIYCWGDSITQGMTYEADQAYPGQLELFLGKGYDVKNSGDGGEDSNTIMARMGVIDMYTTNDITFAEGVQEVKIGTANATGLRTENDDNIKLTAYGKEIDCKKVTIDNAEYQLELRDIKWVDGKISYDFYLKRENATEEITIPAGTSAVFESANKRNEAYCNIVLVGANDTLQDSDSLLKQYKTIVAGLRENANYFVIIPFWGTSEKWTEEDDAKFIKEFGEHAINLRMEAISNGLAYSGLTASEQDSQDIADRALPSSLRMSPGNVHLNDKGYAFLAYCIWKQGVGLGTW